MNNPELTYVRFKHQSGKDNAAVMYRSGDFGAYLPDGNLIYLGRMDHQVKIRGYRIELSEIESLLNRQPEIQLAVVLLRGELIEKNI